MDLLAIEERLEAGENLKIKYRYPVEADGGRRSPKFGMRTDKLVDVSVDLNRFYVNFRGDTPIWLEAEEVIEIVPDDGIYEDVLQG